MELDLVDPVAEAVRRTQARHVLVGQPAVFARHGRPGDATKLAERVQHARGAATAGIVSGGERAYCLLQGRVGTDRVVVDQRRRLFGGCTLQGIHVATVGPWPPIR